MTMLLGAVLESGVLVASITTDGVIVYSLVAFAIGVIAWSKYTEPPLGNPYPEGADGSGTREAGPAGAVAVEVAVPERPPVARPPGDAR